jgi:hypothetical protein
MQILERSGWKNPHTPSSSMKIIHLLIQMWEEHALFHSSSPTNGLLHAFPSNQRSGGWPGPHSWPKVSTILSPSCQISTNASWQTVLELINLCVDFLLYIDDEVFVGVPDPFHCLVNLLGLLVDGETVEVCGERIRIHHEYVDNCGICQQLKNRSKDLYWPYLLTSSSCVLLIEKLSQLRWNF